MYVIIVNFATAFMALAGIVMSYMMMLNHQQRYGKPSLLAVFYAVFCGALLTGGVLVPLYALQTGDFYVLSQFREVMAVICISLGLVLLFCSFLLWRDYRRLVKIEDYNNNHQRSM